MQTTANYNLNKPDVNDYVKIETLNENADIIDAKLKELEDNSNKVDIVMKTVTIPTTGWVTDPESSFYRCDITDAAITKNCSVDISLDLASLVIAEECTLKSVTVSYDGGVYIYAEAVPTAEMTGTMVIQKGAN